MSLDYLVGSLQRQQQLRRQSLASQFPPSHDLVSNERLKNPAAQRIEAKLRVQGNSELPRPTA